MVLTPGTRFGPYEVTAQIGVGGMGEVYRATDTHLKRQVAIKVLPASVAVDADRLARFQREAEVLAALNHPNIAQIHGLEESAGQTGLVLELVEGPTLADRITQGAIPVDEALSIAKQIAEALEAAHEKGIIHRDLKPSNIKVKDDGTVKVLDFGLAKAIEQIRAVSPSASHSPTVTVHGMTQSGVILGTAAYMSPEQARGRTVDRRTDIWAFGCVLYETLSGRRPFPSEGSVSDTLAGILKEEPVWSALPNDTPHAIRTLLERCLRKDVRRRLPDIGQARIEIEDACGPTLGAQPPAPVISSGRRYLWPAIAVLALLAVAALAGRRVFAPAPEPRVVRFDFLAPKGATIVGLQTGQPLSPDGRKLAFVAIHEGKQLLWVRSLDSASAQPLPPQRTPHVRSGHPTANTLPFSHKAS
jgi:serine/threonine protein kinase